MISYKVRMDCQVAGVANVVILQKSSVSIINVICYLDVSTSRTCNLHRHSPCSIKTRVDNTPLHFIARLSFHPSLITVNIFIGVPCPLSLEF